MGNQILSAASDLGKLTAQETLLLGARAKLDEQREVVDRQLADVRANLAGVKLGQRVAAEEQEAAELEAKIQAEEQRLRERVASGDLGAGLPEIVVIEPARVD
jgi:hypothetical protein